MLLSACLIAKNEALTIKRCLTSLLDVVDEIIVVDTGSTDNTVEIATSLGAKVFYFEWDHDFSHARNEALRHASGDWVLVVDADEYLDDEKKRTFRAFLESTNAEGLFITVINYLGSLTKITRSMPIRVMRVFRRGHFYEGAVHEQVAPSVFRSGRPIGNFDLDIHHVGYTTEFIQQRGKAERNSRLLAKELEQDPDNLFHRSNMLAEHILQRRFIECAALAEETFKIVERMPQAQWPNFVVRIMMHWIIGLWETQRRQEAIKVSKKAIGLFPWYTDVKKQYANMLMDEGDFFEAKDMLMQCHEQGDTKEGLVEFAQGVGTYLASRDLGILWSILGDEVVERKWYLQAFMENNTVDNLIYPLVSLLPHDETFFREHIEPRIEDPRVAHEFAEACAVFGITNAESFVKRAVERFGKSEQSERALASVYGRQSRDRLWQHVQQGGTELHWVWMGLYDLERNDVEAANNAFQKAGVRGKYFIEVQRVLESFGSSWGSKNVLHEMIAMHTENLLRKWLLRSTDYRQVWSIIKHSPLKHILHQIEWPGGTEAECVQNALRYFQNKQFDESRTWLKKAQTYYETVTQVLLGCDLALAQNDIAGARKLLYEGKKVFPESEAIKTASDIVHPKIDHQKLLHELREMPTSNEKRTLLQ